MGPDAEMKLFQDEVILEKVAPNPGTCPHEGGGIWTQFWLLRPLCSVTQPGRWHRVPLQLEGGFTVGIQHSPTHEFPVQCRLEKEQISFQMDTRAYVVTLFPIAFLSVSVRISSVSENS